MRYVAIIEGISGIRRVLGRDGLETTVARSARIFRSREAAAEASRAHIAQFAPVVQRSMRFAAVPEEAVRAILDYEEAAPRVPASEATSVEASCNP